MSPTQRPCKNTDTREQLHLGWRPSRSLGLIYDPANMYCTTWRKKNVNHDHLICQAWHLIWPEGRGKLWHELEARGGRALPNISVKTRTQESDNT